MPLEFGLWRIDGERLTDNLRAKRARLIRLLAGTDMLCQP